MDKKKKNKSRLKKFKIMLLLIISILSFTYTIRILNKINLQVDDLFLETLINSSNNIKGQGITSDVVNYVISLDFLNPVNLINSNYKGLVKNNATKIDNVVIKETSNTKEPKDDNTNKVATVYIYNTHQSEEYKSRNSTSYNVNPTVLLASYILQEKLSKLGINSIVEESNIMELLRINNWNYASSYKITKMLLEQAKKDNQSLVYFIDLHRDSISYDKTTITINNKKYAKILFLLGLENPNYLENKKVISKMHEMINEKYPGLSKGIYEKKGKGVNGVYNQDFSKNCILIEVGGKDNTIDEVNNTIEVIANTLYTYIGDNNG